MAVPEIKTGQHIDSLKSDLLHPLLANAIAQIPELPSALSVIDFGPGDASSLRNLLTILNQQGRTLNNLALVDADVEIFPELFASAIDGSDGVFETQVVHADNGLLTAAFMQPYLIIG